VSILAYSKAYRAKNRIIDVIEKYGEYNDYAQNEIMDSLKEMGYQLGNCEHTSSVTNTSGYKYCIEERKAQDVDGYYYKVTTYVQFYFPVIEQMFQPPVTSETKILGKEYDY